MVNIFKDGKRVAQSQNLRGIIDYARKNGVAKVIIVERKFAKHTEFGGTLNILFGDGDHLAIVGPSDAPRWYEPGGFR